MAAIEGICHLYLLLGSFGLCSSKCVRIAHLDGSIDAGDNCNLTDVCRKTFNISYLEFEPYYSEQNNMTSTVEGILMACCGMCQRSSIVNRFNTSSEITRSSINSSHFVYPILGSTSHERLYGFYFLPLIDVPSAYYITTKQVTAMKHLLTGITGVYPLIVVCVLMTLISGFIAWTLETWQNKEQFPRSFLAGWFEGFWWGFVSMTTVGYGDKTPQSVLARLFAMVWILVGITSFSMLTAMLSAEITKADFPEVPKMLGATVGVLKYRLHDAYVVSQNGGLLLESEESHGIFQLIKMLRNGEIDGFLLDKHTLWYASEVLKNRMVDAAWDNENEDKQFFLYNTVHTEIMNEGKQRAYGILVKEKDDFEHFKQFVFDNSLVAETNMAASWNREERHSVEQRSIFSADGGYFYNALKICAIILAVLIIIGIFVEIMRRRGIFGRIKSINRDMLLLKSTRHVEN